MTDPRFWDCDCETGYIHRREVDMVCNVCGARADECPDSRISEILRFNILEDDDDGK